MAKEAFCISEEKKKHRFDTGLLPPPVYLLPPV